MALTSFYKRYRKKFLVLRSKTTEDDNDVLKYSHNEAHKLVESALRTYPDTGSAQFSLMFASD